MDGGDKETLTPSNNRVYNNHIHHWGEGNGTQGIIVRGVGAHIDHNELHDYRDVAINYDDNNHLIEYNLIYNMSLETEDGGAIYKPGDWTSYGCVVRYNAIYNVNTPGYSEPNGIYLDDGACGQTVYGNLLVNIPQNGIKVSGRDNQIWGNIIVNTTENGIYGLEAFYYGSLGFEVYTDKLPDWESSPKDTEVWQTAYPEMVGLHFDETNTDDPNFVGNPANTHVNGNICVNRAGIIGTIEGKQNEYADFSGNAVYTMDMLDEIFVDPENGNYHVKEDSIIYELIPDFEDLPIEKMGRE